MWKYPDDDSSAVLTAKENIESIRGAGSVLRLPERALVFFMSRGVDYLLETDTCRLLTEKLPRFLMGGPVYAIGDTLCFLDGGRGAPQAADTVETLAALGVRELICVGMCGAFSPQLRSGDILVPQCCFSEEGTSWHYYEHAEVFEPDARLYARLRGIPGSKTLPLVSTDGIYRQTYYKEQLWREKGAAAVDMETSAVFSVARCLGLAAAAVLMVSDCHPLYEGAPKWEWRMTGEMRRELFEKTMQVVLGE
ncbi:MAG: nucleoside phosphorylase [Oscillospiraceae bacterium]|jgi:Uridine phosphorylase|nr:nucleoside phosphorylase [Oscillospiraceae bacterium]